MSLLLIFPWLRQMCPPSATLVKMKMKIIIQILNVKAHKLDYIFHFDKITGNNCINSLLSRCSPEQTLLYGELTFTQCFDASSCVY